MKLKRLTVLGFLALMVIVDSCSSVSKTTRYQSSPRIDLTDPNVKSTIKWVDLEISETKTKGVAEGKLSYRLTLDQLKSLAIGNALLVSKSDVLVAPFFMVNVNNNIVKVEVIGFPAKYKI